MRKNRAGRMFIIWVAGGMFTIGFRGCDFHEKDACGSAGSASLTGSGLSAGSSQAVPLLNATFWTLWKATNPRAVDVPALATPRRSESKSSTPTTGRRKLP